MAAVQKTWLKMMAQLVLVFGWCQSVRKKNLQNHLDKFLTICYIMPAYISLCYLPL